METIKDDIKVYDPVNINNGVYYSKIMYKNSEITLQTDKTKLTINKDKNKAKINVGGKINDFIKNVSKAAIEITSEKSEYFFGKKITVEDCESIYKEAVIDNTLHCFFDEDTHFYKSKSDKINLEDLEDELKGIALLKCSAIVYTKHSFFIRWEISQFKMKQDKKVENTAMKEYSIKDLPEHDHPIDGDPLAKKLEEITLF
tara:strand:- start:1658 stop:2260 length:603 start_codon:yes stop_codon:yes gene_type:complete